MAHDVSVIICAHTEKRLPHIRASIAAAHQQTLPAREIIVVIDHNPNLLERVQDEIAEIVAIENRGKPGLSGGKNTGVAEASGDIVAFVDDDGFIAPDWLELLCAPLEDPDVLGVGGRVDPLWQAPRPIWFPEEFHWTVGCSYTGLPDVRSPVRNLAGGCMVVRRDVFDAIGGFRSDIGRIGTKPLGCEETEFCIRASQHWPRRKWIYEPTAVMRHVIPEPRTRWSYFRSRCFFEGVSKARVTRFVGSQKGLAAERTYTLRTLPAGVARNLASSVAQRDSGGLGRAAAIIGGLACTSAGYLYGRALLARDERQQHAAPSPPPAIEKAVVS